MINKTIRDAISAQCIDEISFARNARRPRLAKWWANEDLYYSNKKITSDERTNVNLNELKASFRHSSLRLMYLLTLSLLKEKRLT